MESDRGTEYGTYVAVQDVLLSAYTELRNRLAQEKYGRSYTELEKAFKDSANKNLDLKAKVKYIKDRYPQVVTDSEPTSVK